MKAPSLIRYDNRPRSDYALFVPAVRRTGRNLLEQMFVLGFLNIAAMLLLGAWAAFPPLLPLAGFAPPVLGGLWWCVAHVVRDEETNFRQAFEGAQDFFISTWVLAVASGIIYYLILGINLPFYEQDVVPLPFVAPAWFVPALRVFWVFVGVFWTAFWTYTLAWLVFEERNLWAALKGGAWLLVSHPVYTLLYMLLLALFFVLNSFVTALFLFITWAVLALLSVHSVQLLRCGIPEALPPEALDRVLEDRNPV